MFASSEAHARSKVVFTGREGRRCESMPMAQTLSLSDATLKYSVRASTFKLVLLVLSSVLISSAKFLIGPSPALPDGEGAFYGLIFLVWFYFDVGMFLIGYNIINAFHLAFQLAHFSFILCFLCSGIITEFAQVFGEDFGISMRTNYLFTARSLYRTQQPLPVTMIAEDKAPVYGSSSTRTSKCHPAAGRTCNEGHHFPDPNRSMCAWRCKNNAPFKIFFFCFPGHAYCGRHIYERPYNLGHILDSSMGVNFAN